MHAPHEREGVARDTTTSRRRLRVSRETLVRLGDAVMRRVAGGTQYPTIDTCILSECGGCPSQVQSECGGCPTIEQTVCGGCPSDQPTLCC